MYEKVSNDFFLSTTSLHDGKGGFVSNDRLNKAARAAEIYFQRYQNSPSEIQQQKKSNLDIMKRCGNNQFFTMTDYRAATKTHLIHRANTERANQSLTKSINCLKGKWVKAEYVAKYNPPHVPKDPDITKSHIYDEKNKYSLSGVPNEKTGASGYVSKSITHPFVLNNYSHFKKTSEENGLTLRQLMDKLEAQLQKDKKLGKEVQFVAGQTILNARQVYAHDELWGHSEKIIMKTLAEHGMLSLAETYKIDESLMFEDPAKNIFKRNTGTIGPKLHKIETHYKSFLLRNDPVALKDFKIMANSKNMENLALAHFKLNENGDGFEDSSGLGDSFTSVNATACINHARLMSGEERLSKYDVEVLICCLNAVYDDASGIRHTLHEVARGCFAGAGYTVEDADKFYADVCRNASMEFYGGKTLA
ncbi:type III effector HopG1 [Brenneria alni]|uniref:Type III effector HopG1 n=1 Tax=Brenneria alni TaxID=71656 RepID=A0A421DRV9_9GAMM|nr:type III effector HopG1 [Brenneria alni]